MRPVVNSMICANFMFPPESLPILRAMTWPCRPLDAGAAHQRHPQLLGGPESDSSGRTGGQLSWSERYGQRGAPTSVLVRHLQTGRSGRVGIHAEPSRPPDQFGLGMHAELGVG